MTHLDLLPTDIESGLRASVRGLLADTCDLTDVTAMYDGDRSTAERLWQALRSDLGLAGVLVPEELGGIGTSAREAAVIMEELGRGVAPSPFLTSSIVAATVLLEAKSHLVSSLASGELTVALAVPLSTAPDDEAPRIQARHSGRLNGKITSVAGAIEADILLVPADCDAGLVLYAVDVERVRLELLISLDMTRPLADVSFENAVGELVAKDAKPLIRKALRAGAVMLASEQVGIARWCLESTVEYVKERRQFGRAVGSFQALKHRLADLYTSVESAAAAARYGAVALATGDPDLEIATAVAQSYCSDLAVLAGEEALQLHGGIGMTWEYPVHLYLKRAKADQIAFGTPGMFRARLADLVAIPHAPNSTMRVARRVSS